MCFIGPQTTAGRDHRALAQIQFLNQFLLSQPKSSLALVRKNGRDGFARAFFNKLVRINKFKTQLVGDQPAHGGLSRAHEPDQRDIIDLPRTAHGFDLPQKRVVYTFIFQRAIHAISGLAEDWLPGCAVKHSRKLRNTAEVLERFHTTSV
jgi:hypothetical protein